jgi:hypothetical protein
MFEKQGFYLDESKSRTISSVESTMYLIFVKGVPPKNSRRYKNEIAIQAIFDLQSDISWIREWIVHHINIGIDKFVLYQNSIRSTDQEYFEPTCYPFTK